MQQIKIAIDGPSGVGKTTIARAVAEKLGITYVDTGAMYRAIGLKATRLGLDMADEAGLRAMLDGTALDILYRDGGARVLLDGEEVGDEIRTPQASKAASEVSKLPAVRERMVALQKEIAQRRPVVMDGRDIGTCVMPDARYKFYLTAAEEVRARRRYDELIAKGRAVAFPQVLADMIERDRQDTTRAASPLRPAPDAVVIDTGDMDIPAVLALILSHLEG